MAARTRNLTPARPAKRALHTAVWLTLLILLTVLGCLGACSLTPTEAPSAALSSTGTTMLATGQGLVYGNNPVRLTNVTSYTLSGSAAAENSQANLSVTQTTPHDLYISGNISTNKGKGGFLGSAGHSPDAYIRNTDSTSIVFASYPRTLDSNLVFSTKIGISSTLTAAIKDPMLTVTANVYFTAFPVDTSADYCDVSLTWMPTGNTTDPANTSKTMTSAILNATRNTGTINLDTVGTGAVLAVRLDNFRQAQLAYGESGGWFSSGEDYVSSAIAARFTEMYVKIDIAMNQALQFRPTGANFSDVSVIQADNRDPNCAKDFFKPGDIFEVRTNIRASNENLIMSYNAASADKFFITAGESGPTVKNEFRDFFFKPGGGINLDETSTIEWNYELLYLERIIDDDFDITGQTARFKVLDIPPGVITSIELQPFLRKVEDGYSLGLNRTGPKITLRGDASPPEEPQIDDNDPFLMDYWNEGKWYNKGFQEGSGGTRGVYIKVLMSPASYITGNGSTQRIYYTTDGSNPIESGTRKVLVDNITPSTTNREVTMFFPMPGSEKQRIYTLKMVSYDYAGNISSIHSYSNIKIDCTDYLIQIFFVLGDKLSAPANSSSVTMLGTSELGTYKSDTDKDFKKVATRGYKRGDLIYIQISVKKNSQYRMFQYYNSGQRAYVCNFIDYGNFAAGNFGHFTEKTSTEVKLSVPDYSQQTAIILTDEMLQDGENLKFYFIFKQQLPIMLGATQSVYDGSPKGIEQPTTTYSGIEILTYYKQNEEDPFVSQAMFTQAGGYFYRCEIVDINYFGFASGAFTILKANPFVTGLEVQDIFYENSMASAVVRCRNTNPSQPDLLYTSTASSDGAVQGSFSIIYPDSASQAYIRPSQGEKNITVSFVPAAQYINNYNVMTYNTTMYVHYSTNLQISFQESSFNYVYQRDVSRYAVAVTNPGNQQLIYEYKRQGEPDSAYALKAPVDAGVYEVRVRTDLALCNYDNQKTTEGTELKFVINRLAVQVSATPAVCYFQNDFDPVAEAYLSGNQFIPISEWRYEYFINNQWVKTRPSDAGVYNAKAIVDSQNEYGDITGNYIGEALTTLTIKKGNADAASGFTINYPTPVSNPSILGHISYGQKLSQVNITSGAGYVAEYSFRIISQQGIEERIRQVVPGEFFLATRLYDPAVETVPAFVAEMKNTVLTVARYSGATALYMTYVPEDLVNFNISTWRSNITVVKAAPTFGSVKAGALTYGQVAADLEIAGFQKTAGDRPVYTINDAVYIDGVMVNPSANGLPVTGKLTYIDAVGKLLSAGSQLVAFSFTPFDTANISVVNSLNLSVIVNKDIMELEAPEASDGVISRVYGTPFRNPVIDVYKYIRGDRVPDVSTVLEYKYKNLLGEPAAMTAMTPVGRYIMTVSVVHNNFQGSLNVEIEVTKATPVMHTAPQAGTVRYMMDMSDVNLVNGKMQHPVNLQLVAGAFSFKDGTPPAPDAVGDRQYLVTFTPADANNYNPADITVTIRIQKASAQITLGNLTHTYSGIAQNPSFSTNIVIRRQGENESYVDLNIPENSFNPETDRPLAVEFTYNTYGNTVPLNAGRYQVAARINDTCYEGVIQAAEYVVNQADAVITVDASSRIQSYNSGVITLKASATDMAGNALRVLIAQSFTTLTNTALSDAPRDVGIYNVRLDIRDTNYKGTAVSTLTVTVAQLNILNNAQTYGTRPPVTVEYLPQTASAVIRYQPVYADGEPGDITDVQPTGAGLYKILISFPAALNNGYTAAFEGSLTIAKAEVTLSYSGSFKYTYTGQPRSQLRVDINAVRVTPSALYTLRRTAQFYDEDLDQFSSAEPVNVGGYVMLITIDDPNYAGSAEFIYTIEKASPTIRMNPVVAPLTYTDSGEDAVFSGGEVVFNGEIKPGTYTLAENTMTLAAGQHSVLYRFTPTDSRNLKEVYGSVQISVQQKDLSDKIVFYGDTRVEYNQQPHYVYAYIDSGESVIIDIYYNRSKSAPRERGEYVVTAEIADRNYCGEAEWDISLAIEYGKPKISAPILTDIRVGDPLGFSEIQGGFAYIDGTGEYENGVLVPGTATLVAGTFAFTRPATIMNEANQRDAELSFRPFATNNFSNVTFTTKVRVIGQDPVIGEVAAAVSEEGKTIYYGQTLANYSLSFVDTPSGATPGILSFVDEGQVPEVGKSVKYRFYPVNDILYNIIEGEVAIALAKTTPSVQSVSARAFFGQRLSDAVFQAAMQNQYNVSIPVDGHFSLISVDGFDDLDTVLTAADLAYSLPGMMMAAGLTGGGSPELTGRYRFVSDNYNTVEGDITIICYNLVDSVNIEARRTSKSYNALPIDVADLDILTSFTQHPLFDENYILTVLDAKGNLSDGAAVGQYTVIIEISDIMYYGKKSVQFTVGKSDISDAMSLSYTSAVFGEAYTKPTVALTGDFGDIPQNNFVVEFKLSGEDISRYNETLPSQAGVYDVRITVDNNQYFTGQKYAVFVIQKSVVQVTVSGMIQYYGAVKPLFVEHVEKDLEPTVTYYSPSYNRTRTVPTEAGDYFARVEVVHNNYTVKIGSYTYVEVSFKILQVTLTERDKPIVADIVFGQSYKDAHIAGGRVTYGEALEVQGRYSFTAPSEKPQAGARATSLLFTPYNKNYAPLRIDDVAVNVRRANAEILFTNLMAVYNGANKRNELLYISDSAVSWELAFIRNGIEVEPRDAGSYEIRVKLLSGNYQLGIDLNGEPVLEKSNAATFIINKASMSGYTPPIPTDISYGQSLAYSTLNSSVYEGYGVANYTGIEGYVSGAFSYVNSGLVPGDAGNYLVDIVFLPTDGANYNGFSAKIEITVLPARAVISVSGNEYVYGTPITAPVFTTNPGNLSLSHDMDCLGGIINAGVYSYTVWVTAKNYDHPDNFFIFNITVLKKEIRIDFVQDGEKVEKYHTTYGKLLNAKAAVNPAEVVPSDLYSALGVHINQKINMNYYSIPKSDKDKVTDYGHTPPSGIGDYRVTAEMDHPNYTASATINYDINLGEIEEIHFDLDTLERQVYGTSLVPPVITTKPAGVAYWIDYQGKGKVMPDNAGTYNIVVYFNDPNYTPKFISAMFKIQKKEIELEDIEAADKVFDGVSTISITAKLNGVELGDEVYLDLRASTEDNSAKVGMHKVVITGYSISGLSAQNYTLKKPYFAGTIQIYEKKITDVKSQSYITSNTGFADGVTVDFKEITSANNKENFFTNLLGQKASVQSFSIKENGQPTTLNEKIKVYLKIPDEYLGAKKLEVVGIGALSGRQIHPIREGDYYTFYTDSSGEVVFSSKDFSYWFIPVVGLAVIMILGVITLFWLNPRHRKSKTGDTKGWRAATKKIKKGISYGD